METSKPDRQLIDRFLSGQLTGAELEQFHQRIKHDAVFRGEVELHALLQKGIERSYEQHYRDLIISSVRYRKPLVPSGLKLIFFFLFIMLSASLLWFYLAPDTGRNAPQFSFFDNLKSGRSEAKHKTGKKKSSVSEERPIAEAAAVEAVDSAANEVPAEEENALKNDSVQAMNDGQTDEIIVRKDEMLISYRVSITDLNENKGKESKDELSGTAIDKLNPSAGLPDPEDAAPSGIFTEFWVSPINYRGYRLTNNKLILFGIEEPDRVRLYRMKDNLYMSYQNSYYKLLLADDFAPYQRIREAEVPLAIRSSK